MAETYPLKKGLRVIRSHGFPIDFPEISPLKIRLPCRFPHDFGAFYAGLLDGLLGAGMKLLVIIRIIPENSLRLARTSKSKNGITYSSPFNLPLSYSSYITLL